MTKLPFLVALLCLSFPALATTSDSAPPSPQQQYYIDQFSALEKQSETDLDARAKLLNSFKQPASALEVTAAMRYLRDRISNGKSDPGFHEAYAGLGWSVGQGNNNEALMNTATLMTIATLLIYQTDELRCADKTNAQKHYVEAIKNLKDPILYYRKLTTAQQKALIEGAKPFELKIAKRPVNSVLCENTVSAMTDAEWAKARQKLHDGLFDYLNPAKH